MRYLEAKCKPSPRRTQRRWWGIANRNENKIHVAHRGAGGISRSETTTTIYPCLRRFHASDVSMLSPFLCFLRCFCFRRFHALAGSIIHICGLCTEKPIGRQQTCVAMHKKPIVKQHTCGATHKTPMARQQTCGAKHKRPIVRQQTCGAIHNIR